MMDAMAALVVIHQGSIRRASIRVSYAARKYDQEASITIRNLSIRHQADNKGGSSSDHDNERILIDSGSGSIYG
jgi:hypothetical protein